MAGSPTIAGRFNRRVQVQTYTPGTANAMNESERKYVAGSTGYAAIEPLRGKELIDAQKISVLISYRIRLRYGITVNEKDQLLEMESGSRKFEIVAIINPNDTNRELHCMCEFLKEGESP